MSKIGRDDLMLLAKLSCLSLSDAEADKLAKDLDAAVKYSSVVTTTKQGTELEAFRNVNVFREDVASSVTDSSQILAVAPKTENFYFVVPRVIE